jgi:hypothetical protein
MQRLLASPHLYDLSFVFPAGPFNFHPDHGVDELPTLKLNDYSWSKVGRTAITPL